MSHDTDVIDLTFDDEETGHSSQERALRDIPNSFTNSVQRKTGPKRSQLVNSCLSNSTTFGVLQSYRSNNAPFQIPTIVKIQSLATASSSGAKQRRAFKSSASSSKVPTKKNPVNVLKKSVFNKQTIKPTISSLESIAESIESCIRRHCCDDSLIIPDPKNSNVNDKSIPLEVSLEDIDENKSDTEIIYSAEAIIPKSLNEIEKSPEGKKCFLEVSSNTMLFRQFVSKVMSLEENESDKQRVSEKVLNHHEKATKEYKESTNFADVIKCHLEKIDKQNLYVCLKEVLDALKQNKVPKRAVLAPIGSSSSKQEVNDTIEGSDDVVLLDPSKKKEVDRLYTCLNKLNAKIKKMEETEVDLSDEEDSSFLKMQRYRERFAKVHKKLCEYYGTPYHAGRYIKKKIHFNSTKYPEVNIVIERWLNKKGIFPDFADVMNILKTLNLNLKPDHLHHLAQEVFREIGRKLQRRRELDFWDSLSAYDPCSEDPALSDSRLSAILNQNRKIYKEKETELINSFVEKQLNGQDSDKSSESMEDEDEVSQGTEAAESETTENEDGDDSIVENTIRPPSPSRSPLTEMINEAVSEGLSSLKRKRSSSMGSSVLTKKNSVQIEAEYAPFRKTSREDKKSNPRPALSSKPFGSVGQIIELNYVTVQNPNPILMKSIFNDCTNTIHSRSKSLDPAIKQKGINGIFTRQNNSKFNRSKSFSRSESCLTNAKYALKSHGADDDTSAKSNQSNTESNDFINRNITGAPFEKNNSNTSSSGESGDGDKDKNKKTIDNLEAEAQDDNKDEDDDDDDADEDVSLGGKDATIERCATETQEPEVSSTEDATATLQSCTSYLDFDLNAIECKIDTVTSRSTVGLNRVDCEIEDNCSNIGEATSSGTENSSTGDLDPTEINSSCNIESKTDECSDLAETSQINDEIVFKNLDKLNSNEDANIITQSGVDREKDNSDYSAEEEPRATLANKVRSKRNGSSSNASEDSKPTSHSHVSVPQSSVQQQISDNNSDSKENEKSDKNIKENEAHLSSNSSKIYRKPAWIDNGEESENESDDSFKQADETSCMSDKIVSSTSKQMKDGDNSIQQPSTNNLKKRPNEDQKLSESSAKKPKSQTKKRSNDTLAKENDFKKRRQQEKEKNLRELEKTKQKIAMSGTELKKIKQNVRDDANDIEVISENIVSKPVSEEDRVKRFLETVQNNSSITVTRKKSLSSDAMKALSQLKKLKNISATRVAQPTRSEQAGPSKVPQPSRKSLPTSVNSKKSLQSPSKSRLSFPNLSSPSRLSISNVRGRQLNNGRFPNNRNRNGLPVISSVQSCNRRTPMITSVMGNRGTAMRIHTPTPPRMPTSASRARGRGSARGNTRIVPVVVLD